MWARARARVTVGLGSGLGSGVGFLDSTTTCTPANGAGVEIIAGDKHNDEGELALG